MKKDVIYIDIEDDITAIIEKVKLSKAKIVALVLPKRSTVLNSAVNMKLLYRSVDDEKKRIVLVTSEPALLGLAGGLGMHVTSDLHSKPYIPEKTEISLDEDSIIDGSELDPSAPVGELADVHEATESADEGKLPEDSLKSSNFSKFKNGLSLKIPNFEKFRTRLILIIVGLLLFGVGWWWAFWVAPKASIAITAQTSRIDTAFEFTADTALKENDFVKNQFIGSQKQIKRDVTETITPTGTKNVGDKASGSITIRNCDYPDGFTVAAGSTFESGGLVFESLDVITVSPFSGPASSCDLGGSNAGTGNGTIRAKQAGDQYNLAPTEYSITSESLGPKVDVIGSQMAGGTNKEVKVVTQADVDKAQKAIQEADRKAVIDELRSEFGEDVVPINETYTVSIGKITATPAVGEEATTATASAQITFSILGVARDTLTQSIEQFIKGKIGGGDQTIYDNGMDNLIFSVVEKTSATKMAIKVYADSYIGPNININTLAQDVSGKRFGEVESFVKNKPGVIDVKVIFEPFWIFSAPHPDKIDVQLSINDN
jgi:hypothetical protein